MHPELSPEIISPRVILRACGQAWLARFLVEPGSAVESHVFVFSLTCCALSHVINKRFSRTLNSW